MILLNFATKIKGTSKIAKHEEWIPVESCNFGVRRSVGTSADNGGERNPSTPSFQDVTFNKPTDISSPELFFQSIAGKSLGKATIHFTQTGGTDNSDQVYLTIELEDAIITTYSAGSGGNRPNESFTINFSKISYQYDSFNGTKVVTGTPKKWDLVANKTY